MGKTFSIYRESNSNPQTTLSTEDENQERGNWTSHLEFLLSCIGFAVGLGNVWRFPYLCYRSGGGAFLFPYVLTLFFIGFPLFFMELVIGQYSSRGCIKCWGMAPAMKGIGIGMVFLNFYTGIYYNVIIGYSLYYFGVSFSPMGLPWQTCSAAWNTEWCSQIVQDCLAAGMFMNNMNRCVNYTNLTDTELSYYNYTVSDAGRFDILNYDDPFADKRLLPSHEYFFNQVLKSSADITETGIVVWEQALCLFLAWTLVCACIINGVKSIGKVVYFTATFPYLVLFILLIRGLTLEGATDGIRYFITPRWEGITNPAVWRDAAGQIFFSLSLSFGGLITMSSYNKFHNNCYRDSLLVPIVNCLTSVFAGFAVFSILGFMAKELRTTVPKIATSGFGLVFVAYPLAITRMPGAPLWSMLFFLMLITLALDSQFTIVETVVSEIIDYDPVRLTPYKRYIIMGYCFTNYLLSFPLLCQSGLYWFDLLAEYTAMPLLFFGFFEAITVCYIYGMQRFNSDVMSMMGEGLIKSIKYTWIPPALCFFGPIILLAILLSNFVAWQEPGVAAKQYTWARDLSHLVLSSCVIPILLWFLYYFGAMLYNMSSEERKSPKIWYEKLLKSDDFWGPVVSEFRLEAWQMHKKHGTSMGGKFDPYHKEENEHQEEAPVGVDESQL